MHTRHKTPRNESHNAYIIALIPKSTHLRAVIREQVEVSTDTQTHYRPPKETRKNRIIRRRQSIALQYPHTQPNKKKQKTAEQVRVDIHALVV